MANIVGITQEQKLEFARTLAQKDWDGLARIMSEKLNASINIFDAQLKSNDRGNVWFDWETTDLAEVCGPFGLLCDTVKVYGFGQWIYEVDGAIEYQIAMSLSYSFKSGGSNGSDICRAYFRNGKWSLVPTQKDGAEVSGLNQKNEGAFQLGHYSFWSEDGKYHSKDSRTGQKREIPEEAYNNARNAVELGRQMDREDQEAGEAS